MPDEKGWYHDEKKHDGDWKDRQQVGIKANECIDG